MLNIWIKYWRSDFRRTVLALVKEMRPNEYPIIKKRIRTSFLSQKKSDSVTVLEAGHNRIAVKSVRNGQVSVVIVAYIKNNWEVIDECFT